MLNINDIKIGDRLIMRDGSLADEGPVERIDYDDNRLYIRVPTSNGSELIDVDADEPGLERAP